MSAHLVQDKTINIIVTHLFENVNLEWLAREFAEAVPTKVATGDFCRDLGGALFAMNIQAVERRYGEGEAKRFRVLDYSFRPVPATELEVYDAIKELKYQCCEGTVPSAALYRLLTTLKYAVADALVQDMRGREKTLTDELESSLYARCESCCRGLEHDDMHCGAPTARRLLVESRTRAAAKRTTTTRTNNNGSIRGQWDVLTATTEGEIVWRRYGDGVIVVARPDEDPDDALTRHLEREKREQRRGDGGDM